MILTLRRLRLSRWRLLSGLLRGRLLALRHKPALLVAGTLATFLWSLWSLWWSLWRLRGRCRCRLGSRRGVAYGTVEQLAIGNDDILAATPAIGGVGVSVSHGCGVLCFARIVDRRNAPYRRDEADDPYAVGSKRAPYRGADELYCGMCSCGPASACARLVWASAIALNCASSASSAAFSRASCASVMASNCFSFPCCTALAASSCN